MTDALLEKVAELAASHRLTLVLGTAHNAAGSWVAQVGVASGAVVASPYTVGVPVEGRPCAVLRQGELAVILFGI